MIKILMFTTTRKRIGIWLTVIGLAVALLISVLPTPPASAVTEAELRAETERLQAEIDSNEAYLKELEAKEHTLQNKINSLQVEINTASQQIKLTDLEIERLTKEISETEAELERQKGLLAENIRTLYKEGRVTTLELIASSNSYSDFINQQEYLSRLKDSIQESTK